VIEGKGNFGYNAQSGEYGDIVSPIGANLWKAMR